MLNKEVVAAGCAGLDEEKREKSTNTRQINYVNEKHVLN